MPKRTRSHQVEDESRLAFGQALGSSFVWREEVRDYGIDGEVEQFGSDDAATGLRFLVQLKATDEKNVDKALSVSLSVETAAYYASLTLPVLMVRYVAAQKRLYARWFHENAADVGSGKVTITFRWEQGDAWEDGTADELATEAAAYLALRSARPDLPLPFALEAPDEVLGTTAGELKTALRSAIAKRPDVLKLVDTPVASGALCRIDSTTIHIDLPGIRAASYTVAEGSDTGHSAEQLATDVLALTATAFALWGQADLAGRLTVSFFPESTLAAHGDAAILLSAAMAQARQVSDALDVADALDQSTDDEVRSSTAMFTMPVLHHGASLTPSEDEKFERVLRNIAERADERGDRRGAAGGCVSLGNYFRTRAEPAKAVEWYDKALETDPDYARRAHYWRELAGVLFGTHEYARAAEAYEEALKIGPSDELLLFLHADAVLFSGEYAKARALIATAQGDASQFGPMAEWGLKAQLLEALVEERGISSQKRSPSDANELATVEEEDDDSNPPKLKERFEKALSADGLCALAWWNLAHFTHLEGDDEAASRLFLNSALIYESDVEAWANATIATWQHGRVEFVPAIVITGQRMTGGALLPRLAEIGKEQGTEFPQAEWTAMLDRIVTELGGSGDSSFDIRIIGPGGKVETFSFPRAGSGQPEKS